MRHAKQKKTDRIKRNNTLLFVTKLLLASKYKSILLYLPILFIISVFTFSIDDQEAITLYINKLQEFSDHKIHYKQIKHVQDYYLHNQHTELLKIERHQIRSDFNKKKKFLKQQWEAFYKIKWLQSNINTTLKYDKKNTNHNNLHIQQYEAHHIIPINAGGCNQWWNISPISSKNHHILHDALEEKACFSHDWLHKKFVRFILKLQTVFLEYCGSYINKRGANYAS